MRDMHFDPCLSLEHSGLWQKIEGIGKKSGVEIYKQTEQALKARMLSNYEEW